MIQCLPEGICSWNFFLLGDGHEGRTEISWPGENGYLEVDGVRLQVMKQGFFSGSWELVANGDVVATAKKRAFSRSFEIRSGELVYSLNPESLGRTMCLSRNGESAMIKPVHLFTRRARIEGGVEDFRILCFAFWLTVVLWRRRSRNNAGN